MISKWSTCWVLVDTLMFPGIQLGWVPSFLLQVFGSLDVKTSLPSFLKVSECKFQMETDSDLLILVYAQNQGRELPMGGRETKRSLLQTASLHFGKGIEEEPGEGFSYNAELIQTYCFAVPCLKHCLILCTPVQFKESANTDLQSTKNWNLSLALHPTQTFLLPLHYHRNRTILLQILVYQSFLVLLSGNLASGPSCCISETSTLL